MIYSPYGLMICTHKSLVNRQILCYYAKANASSDKNGIPALMVKRSRRRPLTAESRVRFPMGVPFTDNTTLFEWCCFCVRNFEQALAIGRCFGHKTSLEEVYSVNGTQAHRRVREAPQRRIGLHKRTAGYGKRLNGA